MKDRLIVENKDSVYKVTFIDKHGNKYHGVARCHPDDQKYESELFGYTVANYRAYVKFNKSLIKKEKERLKTLITLYNTIENMKGFNKDELSAKRIRKEIYICKKEIEELSATIREVNDAIRERIKVADDLHKKYEEKIKNTGDEVS